MYLDTSLHRVGQHYEWESIVGIGSNVDISRKNKREKTCGLLIKTCDLWLVNKMS